MQDGSVFPPAVLKITTEDVLAKFQNGVNNLTALSLGSGYVVPSAAPHLIMRAFKNLAAVTFATNFTFPEAAALKSAAAAGPAPEAEGGRPGRNTGRRAPAGRGVQARRHGPELRRCFFDVRDVEATRRRADIEALPQADLLARLGAAED